MFHEQLKQGKSIIFQNTKLGWIISGTINNNLQGYNTNSYVTLNNLNKLNDSNQNDLICEENSRNTTTRDNQGKFIVKIPFNERISELGDSKVEAETRFFSLERRFDKNPKLKNMYVDFMQEYIKLGHMTEIDQEQIKFFLPHHAVLRETSETTKLRVVFDGSCKLTKGIPINEAQYVGPTLQNDLFTILSNFRTYSVVLIADIEKMYRCIWINNEQRIYQGIMWGENENIKYYQLNIVTYGTTSAPFLAIRCLIEIVNIYEKDFPIEANIIRNDFNVDDLVTGAHSIEKLQLRKDNLVTILSSAGFNLRKFSSNINDLNINDQKEFAIKDHFSKTLGIHWNLNDDTFSYSISNFNYNQTLTKRVILAYTAQIFDPLGFISPILITAKFIIQSLWQLSLN